MNRCPQCHSEFADHILYCLNDGQRLEPAGDAAITASLKSTPRRLADLLDAETPMAVARAVRIALAICNAVAGRHEAKGINPVLHPQVISITEPAGDEPPRIKLEASPSPTAHAPSDLSAPYTAPEIAQQGEASAAADIYSLGAIAYKMLTAELPFTAATTAALRVKQLLEHPRPLVDIRPDIPPRLAAVILRALEKEPSARPASIAQLQREIEEAVSDTSAPSPVQEMTGALAAPPRDSTATPVPLPASAPPSAPMRAPASAALPSAAVAMSSVRAAPAKRLVIIGVLALLALLLSVAAFAVYLTQSREGSVALSGTTSEPAPEDTSKAVNADTSTSQPTPAPATQNTSATANSSAPRNVKKRRASPKPNATPPARSQPQSEPPPAARPVAASAPPAPQPAARSAPPPANENTSAPAPVVGAEAPAVNANTSVAAKRRTPSRPRVQPKPRPAAAPPQPVKSPSPQTTPAPVVMHAPVIVAKEAHKARYIGYGRWLVPALLLCLALAVAALALSLLRYRKAPPPALQIAAAPASARMADAERSAEGRTAPSSSGDTQTRAPVLATLPSPQASVPTIIADTPPARGIYHRCPACQTEYSTSVRFCVHDGTTLQEASKALPPKDEPSFYDLQTLEPRKRCSQCGTEYPLTKKFCRYDGEKLIEMKPPKPPAVDALQMSPIVIGQYRCFARLGEGGMGVVYKAQHIHLKRLSAIKVLLPQTAMLPEAVQMFRREAQLASSINHPNSVVIYDYGEMEASLFYLAMEFIAGTSLAEIIAPDGEARPLPLARALDITQQVSDALDAAHQLGIIHRDLKPQNVMITMRASGADFVKVVDFGIARSLKLAADYATLPGVIVGTPAYMSPEQARGLADLDGRSDIYSLGVMVYQILSGALPYPAKGISIWQQIDRRANLRELPPSLNELRPELRIPRAVNDAVMRALDPNRDRRFPSALDFLHDLTQAARPAH
jgi:serine/threonine protein kinase